MDEEIKKIVEQNLKLTEEIYFMTKKMKGYLAFQRLVSLFYLFIIIAPIVLGIIYLPPLLGGLFNQYKDLLGVQAGSTNPIESLLKGGTGGLDLNNIDINNLPPQLKQLLDKNK